MINRRINRRDFLKAVVAGIGAGLSMNTIGLAFSSRGERTTAQRAERRGEEKVKKVYVKLSSFKFRPSVIKVNQGDFVQLVLEGVDLTHGFYIDGYDIGMEVKHAETKIVEFVADKAGAFRIRCTVVCGNLHPFMTGKLIVEPDYRGYGFSLASLAVPLLALLYFYSREKRRKNE